jgi:transcriptional regulator with XRE-family HTH domain
VRRDRPHPIKELRLERGWSQRALGRRARLAPSTISGIECRRDKPSFETLVRLATVLGVRAERANNRLSSRCSRVLLGPRGPEGYARLGQPTEEAGRERPSVFFSE